MVKELNLGENYTPDLQFTINQEIGEHTRECALNMAHRVTHSTCRDCPCHKYKKW
jgi:hypothetical protein